MLKPALIIMAAGMGSRFGGLKQITPVDDRGQIIMDYSLYDARKAGFEKVVFIIKKENETAFREVVGHHAEKVMDTHYAFQDLNDVPTGFSVPEGRQKPWGTAHAVRSARALIREPFAVINADDFYGPTAYSALYDYLVSDHPETEHAMVAYRLRNTVTENGYVARGVCETENGFLTSITERTHIEKRGDHAAFTEDGTTYVDLPGETMVSMNFWGFNRSMMDAFDSHFSAFLQQDMPKNPLKAEYFLPTIANLEMKAGRAAVRVLPCEETWHGVTYREDLPDVCASLADMRRRGIYPENLWA